MLKQSHNNKEIALLPSVARNDSNGRIKVFFGRTLIIFLALICSNSFFKSPAVAQSNLNGLKICIDPGHGPGNANQGPTGLKEHYINMQVARHLQEYLTAAGAVVILTRTEESQDVSLSQREDIANRNNVDFFHSIHHNAFNGEARYTVVIYQEIISQNQPKWPQALRMCQIMAPWIFSGLRTSGWYVRSDYDIRGFNFGVLNDLIMPGTLSEGTFHDNIEEERKLRNDDFLKVEARGISLSFFEYYRRELPATGTIVGYISDAAKDQMINGADIKLDPPGSTYQTDSNNNGFYAFHDIAPGDYLVHATDEGYVVQTSPATVTAPGFTYVDAAILPANPPTVIGTSPRADVTNALIYSPIKLKFDRPMNKTETENAFSIQPPIIGEFSWSADGKLLAFLHEQYLLYQTTYTITLNSTATDQYGIAIDGNGDGASGDPFLFYFTTVPRADSRPVVEMISPELGASTVLPNELIQIRFSKPLNMSTVNADNLRINSGNQNPVGGRFEFAATDTSGWVVFVPDHWFESGDEIEITPTVKIKDTFGLMLYGSKTYSFKVMDGDFSLQLLDGFENWDGSWLDPEMSPNTWGTVSDSTFIEVTSQPALYDSFAAALSYEFLGTGGFVDLQKDNCLCTLDPFDTNEIVQVYIFGDASGNSIRFNLLDETNHSIVSPWTKIDWLGWKLLSYNLSDLSVRSGTTTTGMAKKTQISSLSKVQFVSFQIDHTGGGKGRLVFDNLEVLQHIPTLVNRNEMVQRPKDFGILANYPNPFNPWTAIIYELSSSQNTVIRIIDTNGRVVDTIVDGRVEAGRHTVRWLAGGNASGLYFCEMVAGKHRSIHKMVLSK